MLKAKLGPDPGMRSELLTITDQWEGWNVGRLVNLAGKLAMAANPPDSSRNWLLDRLVGKQRLGIFGLTGTVTIATREGEPLAQVTRDQHDRLEVTAGEYCTRWDPYDDVLGDSAITHVEARRRHWTIQRQSAHYARQAFQAINRHLDRGGVQVDVAPLPKVAFVRVSGN